MFESPHLTPGEDIYVTEAIRRFENGFFSSSYSRFQETYGSLEEFYQNQVHVKARRNLGIFLERIYVAITIAEEKDKLDESWLAAKAYLINVLNLKNGDF
jgi:hypothetical protein